MATQQPAQQADNSHVQKRRGIFPQQIRTVVIVLGLISLIICASLWIWSIWGNLSNVMPVVFTALSAIFGFLALPFLYSSHSQEVTTSPSTAPSPVQITLNQTFSNPQQSSSPPINYSIDSKEAFVSNVTLDSKPPVSPQQSPPSPPTSQQSKADVINRNDLLDLLSTCPHGFFTKTTFYVNAPVTSLFSEKATQAEQAAELIRWAELPGGLGISALYDNYLRANGVSTTHDEQTFQSPITGSPEEGTLSASAISSSSHTVDAISNDFFKQAWSDITKAQEDVNKASAPFNQGKNIVLRQFTEAIELLKTANQHLKHLRVFLDTTSPLPKEIIPQHQDIIHQINIIDEQIGDQLIPNLRNPRLSRQDILESFTPIKAALNEIKRLITKQNISSQTVSEDRSKNI